MEAQKVVIHTCAQNVPCFVSFMYFVVFDVCLYALFDAYEIFLITDFVSAA